MQGDAHLRAFSKEASLGRLTAVVVVATALVARTTAAVALGGAEVSPSTYVAGGLRVGAGDGAGWGARGRLADQRRRTTCAAGDRGVIGVVASAAGAFGGRAAPSGAAGAPVYAAQGGRAEGTGTATGAATPDGRCGACAARAGAGAVVRAV